MLELTDYVAGKSTRFIARRRPGNKGRRYPADPPRVEEIVAVMRHGATDDRPARYWAGDVAGCDAFHAKQRLRSKAAGAESGVVPSPREAACPGS